MKIASQFRDLGEVRDGADREVDSSGAQNAVIPAHAGIQIDAYIRDQRSSWIPARAGITKGERLG